MRKARYIYLSTLYYLYIVEEKLLELLFNAEYLIRNGKQARKATEEELEILKRLLS